LELQQIFNLRHPIPIIIHKYVCIFVNQMDEVFKVHRRRYCSRRCR